MAARTAEAGTPSQSAILPGAVVLPREVDDLRIRHNIAFRRVRRDDGARREAQIGQQLYGLIADVVVATVPHLDYSVLARQLLVREQRVDDPSDTPLPTAAARTCPAGVIHGVVHGPSERALMRLAGISAARLAKPGDEEIVNVRVDCVLVFVPQVQRVWQNVRD